MNGHEIKMLRHSRRQTQAEFAKVLGVSKTAISFWERGATQPSLANRGALEELLPPAEPSDIMSSAAPEMLAVLERFREAFGTHEIKTDFASGMVFGGIIEQTRGVIAKVKGKNR